MPTDRLRACTETRQNKIEKTISFFPENCSDEEHSESEFYITMTSYNFRRTANPHALNYERVGARHDEGNSQEEIVTFVI